VNVICYLALFNRTLILLHRPFKCNIIKYITPLDETEGVILSEVECTWNSPTTESVSSLLATSRLWNLYSHDCHHDVRIFSCNSYQCSAAQARLREEIYNPKIYPPSHILPFQATFTCQRPNRSCSETRESPLLAAMIKALIFKMLIFDTKSNTNDGHSIVMYWSRLL
jgi:hypothetical protein